MALGGMSISKSGMGCRRPVISGQATLILVVVKFHAIYLGNPWELTGQADEPSHIANQSGWIVGNEPLSEVAKVL